MGKWLRVDALWRRHPKAVRAGQLGRLVVMGMWESAKAFDRGGGDITDMWSPEYLADWLGLSADDAAEGMRLAESAGFVNCYLSPHIGRCFGFQLTNDH